MDKPIPKAYLCNKYGNIGDIYEKSMVLSMFNDV
jgi:hypothetical protein